MQVLPQMLNQAQRNSRLRSSIKRLAIVAALTALGINSAVAATSSQTFQSSWTVEPWDYYGQQAAAFWQYTPYTPWNSALGQLESVTVNLQVSGQRSLASDDVSLRYLFFTGWNPNQFQLNRSASISGSSNPLDTAFSYSDALVFNTPEQLQQWKEYSYYPPANYYFESITYGAGHSIVANTTLTYTYTPAVPEPESYALFFAGLLVTTAVVRRKKRAK